MNDINFEVDKSSAIPIYAQITSWIESKITTGEWQPNYRLPGEIELARLLDVSRGSLRKAISQLIKKDLLVQIHGRGTFVSPFVFEQSWSGNLMGVSEEFLLLGIPFETEVLEQNIIPAPLIVAETLKLNPGEPVFYLKRLRKVEGSPFVIHENFFSGKKFHDLLLEDFTKNSLMETLEKRFNISISWASHTIAVVRANAPFSEMLEIPLSDPLLYNEHILYDSEENPVNLAKSWYRSDRYRMRTIVKRRPNELFYAGMNKEITNTDKSVSTSSNAHTNLDLKDLLTPNRIRTRVYAEDAVDAIRTAGRLMVDSGATEERYIDGMLSMAKQLGPYIVISPGVAIPHARPEDGVIRPCLSLITLDPPVNFGNAENDPVSIVLAIAAVDDTQHIQGLRLVAKLLSDDEKRKKILLAKTREDILAILEG